MRSATPKVLHDLAGRPMIRWVLDAVRAAGCAPIVVVVGHGGDEVARALPPDAISAPQPRQLGTADAVRVGLGALRKGETIDDVVVAYGDGPLLIGDLFTDLIRQRRAHGAAIALSMTVFEDPTGYGRIVRDVGGAIEAVVEEKDLPPEQRAIRETNAGQYCFDRAWLVAALGRVRPSASGEYYLTDLVELAHRDGRAVVSVEAPVEVTSGVNDRAQLAWAIRILRERINTRLMLGGVTLVDPSTTYIDAEVEIGKDTIVHPGTTIRGLTVIGERCEIGPQSYVVASRVGTGTRVLMSVVEEARLDENVQVGPFSHLRPGADIARDVVLGNYAEVKNSHIGAGTQMHHFSYLGDADVGADVNVAAGTITCNYNAETRVKSRTIVEDGVALGSDTMLVAPVTVGRDALTGAGSVVTRDVPPGTVVVGVPARPVRERAMNGER
jgi:bifunctional UDP-N-acetylglucosamine pyrophosphorylase/glucosamine-1-phosphate N-acetyltransferase